MSLINDALKRVKEAQHQAPPSASVGPPLRPVEPVAVPAHHGLGWLLPMALVAVGLLTLLLVWQLAARHNSPVTVRAQNVDQEQTAPAAENPPTPSRSPENPRSVIAANNTASNSPSITRSGPIPTANPASASNETPATNSPVGTQAKPSTASATVTSTNSGVVQLAGSGQTGSTNPTVAEVQPPTPPPLKLQGIVYSKRASAVINGKTVFIGDRVREFRVLAITQDAAILVGAGHTNVLSLSE